MIKNLASLKTGLFVMHFVNVNEPVKQNFKLTII